jgi:hypothetical protein
MIFQVIKKLCNHFFMNRIFKYFPAIIAILIINGSCQTSDREISGLWESISIENDSSLFAKTLPSYIKGEVLLKFSGDGRFNWINNGEKLNLSGKYRLVGDIIYFEIESEVSPSKIKYKLLKNKLIIKTDDGFTYTFTRNSNKN